MMPRLGTWITSCGFAIFAVLVCLGLGLGLGLGGSEARAVDEIHPDLIRRVELQWEPVTDAVSYEFQLSTSADFSNLLYDQKVQDLRFVVDLLPGSYYYRVRAIAETGRPGKWTATQQLDLNARPPVLLYPADGAILRGNLPDTGIPMEWRTSGPGIRYLIEIRAQNSAGEYTETLVKQEVDGTVYPFYPQEPGKFEWEVHTLGASGDEPGAVWHFEVEGVVPRGAKAPPGMTPKRIVRYVSPWYRNHWTLYSRYGQSVLGYTIIDQELGATGDFTGLAGYLNETLNWEWHDPVGWTAGGFPWFEAELELDRQTVLSESAIFQQYKIRAGAWYDDWLPKWRFSPVLEFGIRTFGIYQPRRTFEAVRANSVRKDLAFGPAAEYQMRTFLTLGGSAKLKYEFGGDAGFITKNGDNFDQTQRAGNLGNSLGLELTGLGTIQLSPRMKVQGRLKYEKSSATWAPRFFAIPDSPSAPARGDSTISYSNVSFDLSVGIRF